jgi:asparagine synthase (glutamine-hydrolysing)
MSGIAGAAGRTADAKGLLTRMASTLSYVDEVTVDSWQGPEAVLCRVRADVTNPEPQPATDPEGRRHLVLNGEFFGDRDLRQELRVAGDDAALALALYRQHGRDGFVRLNGAFAFAIYDESERELLLVSDRFSSRPIFYAQTPDGGLAFGTQVSSVLQSPDVSRDLDETAVRELFHFQRVHGTRTLSRAVSMLPPASVLRWKDGRVAVEPYWEMDYRVESGSANEYAEALADAFQQSTRRVLESEHRYGLFLSGGLDARMVVAQSTRDLHCYHFNDSENQEYDKAKQIAEVRDFEFTYLERRENHYTDLFEDAVEIGNAMYAFNHAHSLGFGERLREECDVIVHGFAPELYFRGTNLPHAYRTLLGKRWQTVVDWDITDANVASTIVSKLKYGQQKLRPSQLFRGRWAEDFDDVLLETARETVAEASRHSSDPVDHFLWPDTRYHCKFPSFLLESSIRSYMAERSIMFDNDVLDLHLRMPTKLRSDSRLWNLAIRRMNAGVAAVPDANTGHSLFVSEPVRIGLDFADWALRSSGLKPPPQREPGHATGSWPKFSERVANDAKLRTLIADTIENPARIDPEIFDVPRLREMLQETVTKQNNYQRFLFLLITFGRWHERFGPGSQ